MKKFDVKILAIVVLVIIVLFLWLSPKENKVENPPSRNYEISIDKPFVNKINGMSNYQLNCNTNKYTNITIGGDIISESSIKVSDGNEKQVLYVEGSKAKYFGAEYDVIQDDNLYLIIMRFYSVSGLTEVITINKETGIGFDTNTKAFGLSGGPTSDTYLTSCYQI